MRPMIKRPGIASLALCAAVAFPSGSAAADDDDPPAFSDPTRIDNPYLPLSRFHRCTLRGEEDGERLRIRRTVLDRTRTFVVEGVAVEAMVVKDRVRADGELVEETHDFFAQADDGTVHYFGERVDNLRRGEVVDHSGGWLYGEDTLTLGVLMPGDPHLGRHWLSEDAPPITVEHDRVVGEIPTVEVQGHTYRRAIKVREYALPDKEVEYKLYARGVGVIDELPPEGEVGLAGCERA
jgi:hypothetical protein